MHTEIVLHVNNKHRTTIIMHTTVVPPRYLQLMHNDAKGTILHIHSSFAVVAVLVVFF